MKNMKKTSILLASLLASIHCLADFVLIDSQCPSNNCYNTFMSFRFDDYGNLTYIEDNCLNYGEKPYGKSVYSFSNKCICFPEELDGRYSSLNRDGSWWTNETFQAFKMTGITSFGYDYQSFHQIVFPSSLEYIAGNAFEDEPYDSAAGRVKFNIFEAIFQSDVPYGIISSKLLECASNIYYPFKYAERWESVLRSAKYDGNYAPYDSDFWYVDGEMNTATLCESPGMLIEHVTMTNYVEQIISKELTNILYQTVLITNSTTETILNVSNVVNTVVIYSTNSVVNVSNVVNYVDKYVTNTVDIVNLIDRYVTNTVDIINVLTDRVESVSFTTNTTTCTLTNYVSIASSEHIQDSNVGKSRILDLQAGYDDAAKGKYIGLVYDNEYACGIVALTTYAKTAKGVRASGSMYLDDGKTYSISSAYGHIADNVLNLTSKCTTYGAVDFKVGSNGISGTIGNLDVVPASLDYSSGIAKGSIMLRYVDSANNIKTRSIPIAGIIINGETLLNINDKDNFHVIYGETVR